MVEDLSPYRKDLCESSYVSQDSYDKAIMVVSASALTVALSLVKPEYRSWRPLLLVAAACFGTSLLSVIYSFKTSRDAFKAQVDAVDTGRIRRSEPGGHHAKWTERLNRAAFFLLAVGILSLAVALVGINL